MAGISISELINKEDIIDVPSGFIPISINDNTFKIQASTFLTELTNRTNNFETVVEQQSATITQCITDTVSLCASIECNDTDITNLQSNVTNIYSCLTDLSGCVDVRSLICETDTLRNTVESNGNAINNVRTRFTTLSSCVNTINGELELKGSALAVDNLINQANSLDACITNESNKIVDLQTQINALDVCGNAVAIDSLNQRIKKNESFIDNEAVSKTTLDGCISEIDGKISACATATCVNGLETRITITEGVATGAANNIICITNDINTINGTLVGKANASAVNSLASSIATAEGNVSALQNCATSLQTQITQSSKASVADCIQSLQTSIANADSNITQLQTDTTTLNSCIGCVDGCINGQASSISTLQTNVNTINGSGAGSISQVCTIATAACNGITSINAKYGVRLNTCGIVSGFCLNSGGGTSSFKIQANCFILADQTNSNCGSPFSVINNCVRMCGACIKDLSVDTLQINGQAISSCSVNQGNNKTFTVSSNTRRTDTTPLGNYVDIASATIVSAGCPTTITAGYGGTLLKAGYTSVKCTNKGSRNGLSMCRLNPATFSYGAQVRVVRGSTVLPSSNTNTFLDTTPGTGSVTYKLQARFIRNYGNATISSCSPRWTYGRATMGGKISTSTVSLLSKINEPATISPTTQTVTVTNPFIEIRQNKR